jgi:hypothetical protein
MNKDNPFEMPAELSAFAEKSMQQARAAFDAWAAATQQAAEMAHKHAMGAQSGVRELGELAMRNAERNVASAFQFAQKLVRAKDAKDIAALHAEYVKSQMEALDHQARELGERVRKLGSP